MNERVKKMWSGWVAVLLGSLTFVAMVVWSVPGLDPSLWEELAAVAGLRPPQSVFPGFWRACAVVMIRSFGIEATLRLLPILGGLTAALSVGLFFQIVRQLLMQLVRTSRRYAVWERRIVPFFATASTLIFAASDPLWRISQTLSPDGIAVLVFLIVVHLSLRWFAVRRHICLYGAFVLMGLLSAESPFALVLPFVFAAVHVKVWSRTEDEDLPPPEDFPFMILPKWRLFFLFVLGFVVGAALNLSLFESLGGPAANKWASGTSWFQYAMRYWHVLAGSATLLGWLLGLCFGFLPLVLALQLAPRALRDDRRLPFGIGILLLFVTGIALMQTGIYPPLQFWTFDLEVDADLVANGFLLVFFAAGATVALAIGGAAFTLECQRKYLAATWGQALDEVGSDEGLRQNVARQLGEQAQMRPAKKSLKMLVPALTVPLVLGVLVQVPRPVETEMQRIVQAAVEEIVTECGDARWLFSDGRLDAAIELEAFRRGRTLRVFDMMAGGGAWVMSVRLRGLDEDSPDGQAAATGVPVLFRLWAGEKPNGLDESATSVGFEFWKRANKPLPTLSGFVGRTTGLAKEEAEAGIARTRALSDRILALAARKSFSEPTLALRNAFTAVTWRLSRFANLRDERELSDNLIDSSSIIKRLLGAIDEERRRVLMLMTPVEGLQLALSRTDFAEARRYAAVVLRYDEDNMQANFAMAMSAISMNRMQEAELYLKRCHELQPQEVAVINNLSIVSRKLGHYDEAVKYAKQAVELLPDSTEAKQTLEDAEKRRP